MKTAKTQTIKVKVSESEPESLEILAKSIIDVSEAAQKLLNSRLTTDAIVLLIQHNMSTAAVTRKQISLVLETAGKLKQIYLKK